MSQWKSNGKRRLSNTSLCLKCGGERGKWRGWEKQMSHLSCKPHWTGRPATNNKDKKKIADCCYEKIMEGSRLWNFSLLQNKVHTSQAGNTLVSKFRGSQVLLNGAKDLDWPEDSGLQIMQLHSLALEKLQGSAYPWVHGWTLP